MSRAALHLFLIGFRGAGKSTVGRTLARRLGRRFVDLDQRIAVLAHRPVGQALAALGEPAFRRIEARALAAAVRGAPAVIATGGGAVLPARSRALIRRTGVAVWLQVGVEETIRRLRRGRLRPALTALSPRAEVRRLMQARAPLYREVATITIRCRRDPVESIVDRIARLGPTLTDR